MALELLVLALAASHVITIALMVLWFALGKPLALREFGRRFKNEFFHLHPRH